LTRRTGILLALILAGCVVGVIVPAGINWDFGNFYDAGRRIVAGETANLYQPTQPIAGQPPQARTGFFGTPLSAYLYVPFAIFPAYEAMVLFKIQTAIFSLAALFLLWRENRVHADRARQDLEVFAARFALAVLALQPLWTAFRTGGQTTPMVFFLLVLSLLAVVRGRLFWSAVCFSAAVMIKPVLITAIAAFTLLAGFRMLWRVAVVFGVMGLVSLAVFGWPVHQAYLDAMRDGAGRIVPWFYNSSAVVALDNLQVLTSLDSWARAHVDLLTTARLGIRGALVAMCVWVFVRSRCWTWSTPARLHFSFMMALLIWVFFTHIVYEAYLTFVFVVLAYWIAVQPALGRPATRWLVALVASCFIQNIIWVDAIRPFVAGPSVPGLVVLGLIKGAMVILLAVWVVRFHRRWFETYRDPIWREGRDVRA
jgi:hypothetical protein